MEKQSPLAVVDAHVHLHACFDLGALLAAASRNLRAEAQRQGRADHYLGMLLLCESAGRDAFATLAASPDGSPASGAPSWTVHRTGEEESLRLEDDRGAALHLVCGFQIVTRERLEVLSLLTRRRIEDGLPLRATVGRARALRAVPVIPWGFGKWTGRRGSLLRTLLDAPPRGTFLGDNAGRPGFLPRPETFLRAEGRGWRILPGSDALPFPSEVGRVGSFGFSCEIETDGETPASSLRRTLMQPDFQPRPYGAGETPLRFARHQLAMQVVRRLRAAG